MRLLHSRTLELKEFLDSDIPLYAILSHTWGQDEISFAAMQGDHRALEDKAGYRKIKAGCEIAATDGYEYFWVDTCCIDKSSSAELSEAINSMFRFYERAEVCYVYLSDVHSARPVVASQRVTPEFAQSRWFTRGWTLQELIAPGSVIFYNSRWEELGSKFGLRAEISDITGIQREVLAEIRGTLDRISIAQRMSWAARRETSRLEDEAYSLMGIFDINMPMLYGEGQRAFFRLQEEILKRSSDHSIFAWEVPTREEIHPKKFLRLVGDLGMLAPSPYFFVSSGDIIDVYNAQHRTFTLTNMGLRLELPKINRNNQTFVVLDCRKAAVKDSCICVMINGAGRAADRLLSINVKHRGKHYHRMFLREFPRGIGVEFRGIGLDRNRFNSNPLTAVLDLDCLMANGLRIVDTRPQALLRDDGTLLRRPGDPYGEVAAVKFVLASKNKHFLLTLGPCLYFDFRVCVMDSSLLSGIEKMDFSWFHSIPYEMQIEYPEEGWAIILTMRKQMFDGKRTIRILINVTPL